MSIQIYLIKLQLIKFALNETEWEKIQTSIFPDTTTEN